MAKENKKRPKSYEFFQEDKDPSIKKKKTWKNIWKWARVFLYVFIFAVTLTGCIQSFVIKTSTKAGAGLEFYNSSDRVAPNATVLKLESKETDGKKEEFIKIDNLNENFYVSTKNDGINYNEETNPTLHPEIMKEMIQQIGGEEQYRAWASYNSLPVLKKNGQYYIFKGDNGRYIFNSYNPKNKSQIEYKSAYETYESIKVLNPFLISLDLNKEDKNALVETLNQVVSKNDFPTVLEVQSKDYSAIAKNNALFARDILEYIYRELKTFTQYKDLDIKALMASVDKNNFTIDDIDNLKKAQEFSRAIKPYLDVTYFASADSKNAQLNVDSKNKQLLFTSGNEWKDATNSALAFSAPESHKVIITWGESWQLGPFYSLFVWPMSKLMNAISDSMPLASWAGWPSIISIIIAVLLTKLLSFALRFKSLFSQNKQKELQIKKAKIDAKYAPYKGNKAMEQRQRQEVADLYKKSGFSPMQPLKQMLITMPIFIAMWRIVQGLPSIKATTWLSINLSSTSWKELFQGYWAYLPILIIVVIVQVAQQLLPKILSRKNDKRLLNASETETMKKQNKTQNIMIIVFVLMGVLFQASVQIYWIVGGIWEIGQILFVHYFQRTEYYKRKVRPWLFKEKTA